MRTRIFLNPSNKSLAGYNVAADFIDAVCGSSISGFSVTMPDLLIAQNKEFNFYNVCTGLGNTVKILAVSGQRFSDGSSSYDLPPHQWASFVSDLKSMWLMKTYLYGFMPGIL
jgi:hypothetical protein